MLHMLDTDTCSYIVKGRSPGDRSEVGGHRALHGMRIGDQQGRVDVWPEADSA